MPGRARRALFTEQDATDYCRGHRDGLGVATGKRRHLVMGPTAVPGRVSTSFEVHGWLILSVIMSRDSKKAHADRGAN